MNKPFLLVVDIGNTNTVFGVFDGEQLLSHWRIQTHSQRTADELGILIRQFFQIEGLDTTKIQGAIVACVMPTALPAVNDMLTRYCKVDPLLVGPGIRTQMPILCENPREVGADRIVNAVGAYARYRQGLIVVDFGTATTFDAVSPRGEYLGGVIAPGIKISAEALFQHASKLPRVELVRPERVVGRNTVTSMQSGLIFGYVGLVEEIVRRMRAELGFDVQCVATGGLADLIASEAPCIKAVHSHLTLEGLRLIFERNAPRSA